MLTDDLPSTFIETVPTPFSPRMRLPYKKVLYLKQDYPDNYVDSTFLEDLQRNGEYINYATTG